MRREEMLIGDLYLGDKMVAQSNGPQRVTMVVGTEAADVINVACTFEDAHGKAITEVGALLFYLADDATGETPTAAVPDASLAIGTDGALLEIVSNSYGYAFSDVAGAIDIDIGDVTGTPTWYLCFVLPNGKLAISGAITFA